MSFVACEIGMGSQARTPRVQRISPSLAFVAGEEQRAVARRQSIRRRRQSHVHSLQEMELRGTEGRNRRVLAGRLLRLGERDAMGSLCREAPERT